MLKTHGCNGDKWTSAYSLPCRVLSSMVIPALGSLSFHPKAPAKVLLTVGRGIWLMGRKYRFNGVVLHNSSNSCFAKSNLKNLELVNRAVATSTDTLQLQPSSAKKSLGPARHRNESFLSLVLIGDERGHQAFPQFFGLHPSLRCLRE